MAYPPITRARQRQVEIILRAYLDDCAAVRLTELEAAYPGGMLDGTPRPPGFQSRPTERAALHLATDLALQWARWRQGHVWRAYQACDPDARNLIAVTYWSHGGQRPWQEAARLLHWSPATFYVVRRRALRVVSAVLPPESQDLATWFGEYAGWPPQTAAAASGEETADG